MVQCAARLYTLHLSIASHAARGGRGNDWKPLAGRQRQVATVLDFQLSKRCTGRRKLSVFLTLRRHPELQLLPDGYDWDGRRGWPATYLIWTAGRLRILVLHAAERGEEIQCSACACVLI
jgi:hypothetical protein